MKEALKLALDVLNESWHLTPKPDYVRVAITAIEAALAAQPAHVISEKEQLKQWIATTNYYRAKREYEPDAAQPAQRPWVGLTEAQFLEATRLAENGNYLVAFVRIQEWLKEKNT
jgi:aminoglycoside/choline kinase family phosphotransferase